METHRSSKLGVALKIFVSLLAAAVFAALAVTAFAVRASYLNYASSISTASIAGGLANKLLLTGATTFAFALGFTAAHAFVLGLLLLLLGMKLRLICWWSCLLVSFLIGFIPSALVGPFALPLMLAMRALGLLSPAPFFIARANRRDESKAALPDVESAE